MRTHKNRIILFGLFAFVFGATFAFLSTSHQDKTEAASTSGFRAGNIISDSVMTDYNSMTVAQIQTFLKSKNACNQSADPSAVNALRYDDVNETQYGITYNRRYYFRTSTGTASGLYHVKDNKFVCLADETINGQSAAYVIWDAAQAFKINPKVLIVLLEKEQSLITDKWPYHLQYRSATGYGCPDSAACDSKYYGLEAQIGNAAYLFSKIVYENKYNLYPIGNNYVKYNYNSACGGSTVNIENRATGALYTYTPYQPNAASLAAGYGTSSDGCGAYGNRNFYLLFTDWFGDTHTTVSSTAANLSDGIYTIAASSNTNYLLDLKGASLAENTNIHLYAANNTIAQKFVIRKTSDGFYLIESLKSGKYLSVNQSRNNVVDQSTYTESNRRNYLWSATIDNNGLVTFTSVATGLVLDVYANSMVSGTTIQGYDSNNTAAQKFKLNPIAESATIDTSKTYTITSKITNDQKHVVDVAGAGTADGTNIRVWTANQTKAQKFQLEALGNGFYRIIATTGTSANGTPMVMDVSGARTAPGTNVNLWTWNGTIAQQWMLVNNGDSYSLVSRCNGLFLDITDFGITDGTNIQLWTANGSSAQKFALIAN